MHHFNRQSTNNPANTNARLTGQPNGRSQSAFVPTPQFQALLNQANMLALFQRLAGRPNNGAPVPAQMVAPEIGALPIFGAQVPGQVGVRQMAAHPNFGASVPGQLGAHRMGALLNFGAQAPVQMGALPIHEDQVHAQMRALHNFGTQTPASLAAYCGALLQAQMAASQMRANPMALPLAALAQLMSFQQQAGLLGNRWMNPQMPAFNAPGFVPQVPVFNVPGVAPQVVEGQIPEARRNTNGTGEVMGSNIVNENVQTPSTISASPSTRPTTSDLNLVQPGRIVQPTRNVTVSATSVFASTIPGPSYSSYLDDYGFDSEEDKDVPCCSSSLRPDGEQPSTSSRKRAQKGKEGKEDDSKKSKRSKKEEEQDKTKIKIEDEEDGNETDHQVVLPRRNIHMPTQAKRERIDGCQAPHCILREILPRLPKNQDVHWVQCDNEECNKWYHSVCVRMTNTKFRETTAFVCCGKEKTQDGKNVANGAIFRRWKKFLANEGMSCRSQMLKEEEARRKK